MARQDDGSECPFLIDRIARSLIRAAFASSFDGIFLSTSFSKSNRASPGTNAALRPNRARSHFPDFREDWIPCDERDF
jgi:hypothetical protein